MKKKEIIILIISILFGIGISIFAQGYYFSNKWGINTYINGNNVSYMTLEESKDLFSSEEYSLIIYLKNEEIKINGEDISFSTNAQIMLEELFRTREILSNASYEIDIEGQFNEDLLYDALKENINEDAQDAYITFDDIFLIEEEAEGIDLDSLYDLVCEAIVNKNTELDLSDSDIYIEADITYEDLKGVCNEANTYLLHTISFKDLDDVLTSDTIETWISIENNEVILDEEAVYDWVEELCLKYKTVGTSRTFTAHDGESITVSGGDYGWQIDYDALCEDVLAAIYSSEKEVTIEVDYTSTGYTMGDIDWDINNYSEVDISEQMVYVYKDGKLAYSCKCVTGLPDGNRDTETGIWYIKDKKETYTMTSETYGYVTPTKYWIRITWSGIGYHWKDRSDWDNWSDQLYKTAGSHGCVNLTLEDAEAIYNLVSIGDAVIIHD